MKKNEDDLERCRRARNAFDSQFKTLDELFDFLKKIEKKAGRRVARVGSCARKLP